MTIYEYIAIVDDNIYSSLSIVDSYIENVAEQRVL